MKYFIIKFFDWVFFSLASLIVILAVLLSLARLFLPHLTSYKPRIQTWASTALNQPVQIGEMSAAWRGLEPELQFKNVEILGQNNKEILLRVKELSVGVDLIKSLLTWQIKPGEIVISGANLTLQQTADGKLIFNGINPQANNSATTFQLSDVSKWLLSQNRIILEHINLLWEGKDGKQIPFKHIKLKLTKKFLSNQLEGSALIAAVPEINTRLRFNVKFTGNILNDNKATTKLYANLRNVPLSFWFANHISNLTFKQGVGDFDVWGTLQGKQLQQLQTQLKAKQITILSPYLTKSLSLPFFAGTFTWQRNKEGWGLNGKNMEIFLTDNEWPLTNFAYNETVKDSVITQNLQLTSADVVRLKTALLLTKNLLSNNQYQILQQLNPTGTLENLSLTRTNSVVNNTPQYKYSYATEFFNVAWSRWQKFPGVRNLTGKINANSTQGELTLNSKNSFFDFGKMFRIVLPVTHLETTVDWEKIDSGWQIHTDNLTAQNEDIGVDGKVSLVIPTNKSSPIINLLLGLDLANLPQIPKYLPVSIMSKGLVNWLDHAIISSQSLSGTVVLTGPLNRFPFVNNEGSFIADLAIKNLTLNYAENWPIIKNINGKLEFNNAAMTASDLSGKIFNADMVNTQVNIPDLRNAVLQVKGNAQGQLNDVLNFLQKSPLNDPIGRSLQGFILNGPMNLNIQLALPLKNNTANKLVSGTLHAQNASLEIPQWWNLTLNNMQTNLNFTHDSLEGLVTGQFFGAPLTIKVSTLKNKLNPSIIQFDFGQGQMSLSQISQRFNVTFPKFITGNLNYHALLQTGATTQFIIDSNLQGTKIALPAPFNKESDASVPSQIKFQFAENKPTQLLAQYGDKGSAALNFVRNSSGNMQLYGGAITLGKGKANSITTSGLIISGALPSFKWEDWQPLFKQFKNKNTDQSQAPPLLRELNINFGQLILPGITLQNTQLQLQPTQFNWNGNIVSDIISGKFSVPYSFPKGTVTADLKKIYWPTNNNTSATTHLNPTDLPNLIFNCDDFHYGNKQFGSVKLNTSTQANGLLINNLNVQSKSVNLTATGTWTGSVHQQTTLQGKLTTNSLGNLLQDWGVTKSVVGSNGNADFSLQWAGAPYKPLLTSLAGNVSLQFHDGRIINLSKTTETELGLGRVLNLFSLQTLPRRLRLDFSDLTDNGFSFDIMKGSFNLENGNAFTQDAYLNGPVAKIAMQGRIGLAKEDYDLTLMVTAYITSSLPAVATVAGGPIVGAVTWVASKVLSPAVNEFTTYHYEVTGPWNNPTIDKAQPNRVQRNQE